MTFSRRFRDAAIGLVIAFLAIGPAVADDISNGSWNTTDASNNASPPNGWPAGMTPNNVEPSARANMGGVKRFWERSNPGVSTTGSSPHYIYTPTNVSYPTAYTQGEVICAKANFTSVGGDDLNVNSLGAKPLYISSGSGVVAISAGQIRSGGQFCASYDSALNSSSGGFQLLGGVVQVSGALLSANNLSDLASASTARTNLGLGSSATLSSSTFFQVANNLSEGTPATMRTNLGLGTAAVANTGSSGHNLVFADVANTFSAAQAVTIGGGPNYTATTTGSGSYAEFIAQNNSTSAAQMIAYGSLNGSSLLGVSTNNLAAFLGNGSAAMVVGTYTGSGPLTLGTNNTAQELFTSGGGISCSGASGGDKGSNTFNCGTLYQGGTALGNSAFKSVSNNADSTVASVASAATNDFASFADNSGTVKDSGLSSSSFLQPSNNLSDVSSLSTAKSNLGISHADVDISDASGIASSTISASHGMGTTPLECWAQAVNVSGGTQNGYANGAHVNLTQGGTSRNDGVSVTWNSSTVTVVVGANGPILMDAGTFQGVLIGSLGVGHWHIHGVCIAL